VSDKGRVGALGLSDNSPPSISPWWGGLRGAGVVSCDRVVGVVSWSAPEGLPDQLTILYQEHIAPAIDPRALGPFDQTLLKTRPAGQDKPLAPVLAVPGNLVRLVVEVLEHVQPHRLLRPLALAKDNVVCCIV
jgi:hypothetical protein